MDAIREHEVALTGYALDALGDRFGDNLTIYGPLDTAVARRRDLVPLRRHPRPRHLAGRRRGGGVRARRPPLRQAADARARRPRHHPCVVLRLQRRSRRRRPRRRAGHAPRSSSPSRASPGDPMPGLEDLYREIILDHYRAPAEPRRAPGAARAQGRGVQPAVRRRGRALPRSSTATPSPTSRSRGQGCSISQASTSMMSAAVKGKSVDEARRLIRAFKALMSIHESKLEGEGDGEDLARRPRGRAPRRPRGAAGRREVPGAHQVRHPGVEHAPAGPRRDRRRLIASLGANRAASGYEHLATVTKQR